MRKWLWLDYETRSMLNIKNVGLDRYAKDLTTEILMLAYAFNDEYPKLWLPILGEPMPAELYEALIDPEVELCAWNYNFEKDITEFKLGIQTSQSRWYDPSVLCAYMSLPIGLDRAGKALETETKKIHITGDQRPVKLFSQPSKATKRMLKNGGAQLYFKNWETHPDDWKLFCEYCIQDVTSERAVHYAAIAYHCPMTPGEVQAWLLDQRMNENGVWIDQQFVENAKKMAMEEAEQIMAEMKAHTGLENPNSRDQMLEWLKERGYPYESLDVEHIEEALKLKFLKPLVRTILELKQKLGGSAYKKLQSIQDRIGIDGRLRDQFVYHGAHTGRWSGRGVQLQNLYKPDGNVVKFPWEKGTSRRLDVYTRAIRAGKKIISKIAPMEIVASTIRSSFSAAPGNKLVVGDLAQIESRVLAALAGCQSMIDAYASGRDLYKECMASQLGKDIKDITSSERSRGKVIILGCGYGMGWEKFIEYALTYGITLGEKEAKESVNGFRETYPEIPKFWERLNDAVIKAVKLNICVYVSGLVVDGRDEHVLKIKLPSGRAIHYFKPFVTLEAPPWGGPKREQVSYTAYDSKGSKVKRLYGGLLVENVVQAVARDLLLSGMLEVEKLGFKVIMTIHDEVAGEVPIDSPLGLEDLLHAMTIVPDWGEGMGFVLAAEGYENQYYKK